MRVEYLPCAFKDLRWFYLYYKNVFTAGKEKAHKQLYLTEELLIGSPYIGHSLDDGNIREFSIPNIPFSFVYRVKGGVIEVLRAWDERQDREKLGE